MSSSSARKHLVEIGLRLYFAGRRRHLAIRGCPHSNYVFVESDPRALRLPLRFSVGPEAGSKFELEGYHLNEQALYELPCGRIDESSDYISTDRKANQHCCDRMEISRFGRNSYQPKV